MVINYSHTCDKVFGRAIGRAIGRGVSEWKAKLD
jgi:hypothetical protein